MKDPSRAVVKSETTLSVLDNFVTRFLEPLERTGAAMPELVEFFSDIASLAGTEDRYLSCVQCRTSDDDAEISTEEARNVGISASRMHAAFYNAVLTAKNNRQLSRHLKVDDAAIFLTGFWHGLTMLLTTRTDAAAIESYVRIGLNTLES